MRRVVGRYAAEVSICYGMARDLTGLHPLSPMAACTPRRSAGAATSSPRSSTPARATISVRRAVHPRRHSVMLGATGGASGPPNVDKPAGSRGDLAVEPDDEGRPVVGGIKDGGRTSCGGRGVSAHPAGSLGGCVQVVGVPVERHGGDTVPSSLRGARFHPRRYARFYREPPHALVPAICGSWTRFPMTVSGQGPPRSSCVGRPPGSCCPDPDRVSPARSEKHACQAGPGPRPADCGPPGSPAAGPHPRPGPGGPMANAVRRNRTSPDPARRG